MSGNLQYIKGIGQGSKNLGLELEKLLEEYKAIIKQVSECRNKINTYVEKLSAQSEKLAEALGDSDEDTTKRIIKEDSTLSESALSLLYKLQLFESELKECAKHVKQEHSASDSAIQQMCKYQIKMQQDFLKHQQNKRDRQFEMQKIFMDKQTLQTHNLDEVMETGYSVFQRKSSETPPADMRLADGELLCVPNTWMKLKLKETNFIHELNSKLNSFRRCGGILGCEGTGDGLGVESIVVCQQQPTNSAHQNEHHRIVDNQSQQSLSDTNEPDVDRMLSNI
ncbi:hypothetical protein DPMN_040386 [Dreissena polymorpha]|uniref:Uncharacterized protein n=1 Tax=Dreissena polymorpha TaxID=45954 RepID=A0A9D4CWT5_DREPO|nr:hypothetical protein DPMN_040386 [Dreissena polymorpha]